MLRKEDRIMIEKQGSFFTRTAELAFLYLPCMGKEALALYTVAMVYEESDHEGLCVLLGCSIGRLEENRRQLERYGLLKTYYRESNRTYLWKLQEPLAGDVFLRHEIFGRWYLSRFGKQRFDEMCTRFERKPPAKDYLAISAPFQETMAEWSDASEQHYQAHKPDIQMPQGFDYQSFLQISELLFPKIARTRDNLALIGQLALNYGIHANEMKKWVAKAYDMKNATLDEAKLRYYVTHIEPREMTAVSSYQQHPITYLKQLFPDVPVNEEEKRLIERLLSQYHFTYELFNFLLEYGLSNCGYKLIDRYVYKVASSWKRNQIDTVDAAKAAVRKETKSKQDKPLPSWYYEETTDGEEVVSDEEIKELLASLGGE